MKKSKVTKNNGITLIALVITIIILLILAGVTIATLTGENGILTRATEAREQTEKKSLKEEIQLAVESDNIGNQVDGNGNLEEELNKINGATISKIAEDTYYVERDGHSYTVYEDGTVEEGKVDIWDGEKVEKPEVDEQGNWHIYTTGQMKFFANYCNNILTEEEKVEANMPEITETTTVYLENNLDMGARQKDGTLTTAEKTQWTPVKQFKGIFDGKNHTILGIYVKTDGAGGLFIEATNLLQNITVKNGYIEGITGTAGINGGTWLNASLINCHNENTEIRGSGFYIGGITSCLFSGNIENCTNTGKITVTTQNSNTNSYVGGIVGGKLTPSRETELKNCSNSGEIYANLACVGGIIGFIPQELTVMNSYNTGKIVGDNKYVGGITGKTNPGAMIKDCYNKGEVIGKEEKVGGITGELSQNSTLTNSYNEGKVTGEVNNVGGIAGIIFGTIENSYNKGPIEGLEQVGGIAGQIGTNCEANIKNCYNEGNIIGRDCSIGGIVGFTSITGTVGTIENNYNKGTIKGVTEVGGIIGINVEKFVVTKCYNKGIIQGTTNIGSVIGKQLNGNDNLSKLYYLNTLNIGAINGQDVEDKNIIGVNDNINSYEEFLIWIEGK